MSDDLNSLYRLTEADIKQASEILAKAFFEKGDFSRLSEDPVKRLKYLTKIAKLGCNYTLNYGELLATSKKLEGVAAWLPHNRVNIPIWQYIRYGMLPIFLGIGRDARKELTFYDNLNKKKHKEHANFPHWYLFTFGVDPTHQGKGWASVLLNPMLAKVDKDKLPCYLETGQRNVSLYEHFGFEVIDRVSLPQFDDEAWFMIRYNK